MKKRKGTKVVARSKRLKFDDLVRVDVGTGANLKSFTVHGDFLSFHSLFFKKALSGPWKEAGERVIKLPEDNSDTFELYLQCVYGQDLSVQPDPIPELRYVIEEQNEMAKLYVFAEKVQDVRTKNTTMKAFLNSIWIMGTDKKWRRPKFKCIDIMYNGTSSGSPMRRLLVDIFAYAISHEEQFEDFPQANEFLIELSKELIKARVNDDFKKRHLRKGDSADAYLEMEDDQEVND